MQGWRAGGERPVCEAGWRTRRPPWRGRPDGSQSPRQRVVTAALRLPNPPSWRHRQVRHERSCQEWNEEAGRGPGLQFVILAHPGNWDFLRQPAAGVDSKKQRSHQMGVQRHEGEGAEGGRGHLQTGPTPSRGLHKFSLLFSSLSPPHSKWETRLREEPEGVKLEKGRAGIRS